MSENCSHNCSSCAKDCNSRKKESFLKEPHKSSSIKKVTNNYSTYSSSLIVLKDSDINDISNFHYIVIDK